MPKLESDSVFTTWQSAHGKIILFGEHAVVYGVEAVAAAIPNMLRARASASSSRRLLVPEWGLDFEVDESAHEKPSTKLLAHIIELVAVELGISQHGFKLEVQAHIPPASGLGASAAISVSVIKALAALFKVDLGLAEVNQIAFKCEQLAHGAPSGLDNTLATYGGVLRFKRSEGATEFAPISVKHPIDLLVVLSGKKGYTAKTVARVREAKSNEPLKFEGIFADIAELSRLAIEALASHDESLFASLLRKNQNALVEIGVSCKEIERVLTIAYGNGCKGGKLTGSGDGGAVILFPGEHIDTIEDALNASGFKSLRISLPSNYEANLGK